MPNTIPPIKTPSSLLEEIEPLLQTFLRWLGLSLVPASCQGEKHCLERFFSWLYLAKKHYRDVIQADIENYVLAHEWSQHTRAHTLFAIRRFYEYLKDQGLVPANPAAEIKIVYPRKGNLVQAPTLAEVRQVFRVLERTRTMQGLRLRLMVELAYGSGLRAGEIATLNILDVNLPQQTAHVLCSKGRKERVVPLTSRCLAVYEKYCRKIRETRLPLFVQVKGPNQGQRLSSQSVSQIIKKKTGYHAHLYRHACATHMLLAGCNVRYIQELLGHERTGTTQIYTRLRNEELRQVISQKHPCASRLTLPNYMRMKNLNRSH
jgi:integrase/recombinase XerD